MSQRKEKQVEMLNKIADFCCIHL